MKTWVMGIDYSMSCPAVTIINRDGDFTFDRCQMFYLSDNAEKTILPNISNVRMPVYNSNEQRFDIISTWATNIIWSIGNAKCEVFIENYAMAGKGRVFEIGENTGLLKHKLHKMGIQFYLIPPTVIKQFATGKGNSDKNMMHEAFIQKTGINLMQHYQPKAKKVGSPVGDLVDSFFIANCGWEGLV